MEFTNFLVFALIALFANSVLSAEVPPACIVRFFPGNSGSRVLVQNLAEGEYHVQLDNPVQELPSDFRNQNILKYAGQKYPTVSIQCISSYVSDFSFQGVEAIQYLNIEKSRKFVPEDSQTNLVQNISVVAVLTANATGEYVIFSKENPLLRTSYFIFAQTETAPFLLGRGRRLVGTVNNNNIVIPCVSANPTEPISLFQKSYEENQLFVHVNDPSVQYDRKVGFIIPRKRNTANRLLGEYRCTAAGQGANAVDYVIVDVAERPIPNEPSHPNIHISVYRNGGAECVAPQGTKVQLVKLLVSPNEGAVLVDCFARRNKVCGDVQNQVFGVSDSWRSASTIRSFTDASGFLVCYTDNEIISTPFIKGLDGIYYKRAEEIPIDFLLRVTIDNQKRKSSGAKLSKSSTRVLISSEATEGAFVANPRIYYVKYNDGSMSRIGEITYFETAQALEFYITSDVSEVIVNDVLIQTGKAINVAKSLRINRQQCDATEFRCDSDECIGLDERCDHVIDCNDGISDEINCTNYTRPCLSSEFQCASGQCIPEFKKCNQKFDCLDHSDETTCTAACAPDYFKCKNGECVRKSYACDSDLDCSDGSDEFAHICHDCNGDHNKFKCTVGGCISRDRVCDGEPNCDDKSDETPAACRAYIPRIVNSRSRYSFTKGDDHYLVCEVRIPAYARGHPRFLPRVTWREPDFHDFKRKKPATFESIRQTIGKNHHLLNDTDSDAEESEYGFFYRLSDFDSYDTGVYVCEATNIAGSVKREFTVAVDECTRPTTQRPGRPSRPDGPDSEIGEGPEEVGHEFPDHPFIPEDNYECNRPGKYPDPDDCAVYHECISEGDRLNHYRFNCGPGTVYCAKSEHCGWERDCPCYDRRFTNRFDKKFKQVIKRRQ